MKTVRLDVHHGGRPVSSQKGRRPTVARAKECSRRVSGHLLSYGGVKAEDENPPLSPSAPAPCQAVSVREEGHPKLFHHRPQRSQVWLVTGLPNVNKESSDSRWSPTRGGLRGTITVIRVTSFLAEFGKDTEKQGKGKDKGGDPSCFKVFLSRGWTAVHLPPACTSGLCISKV